MEEYKGEESTITDIKYLYKMGKINLKEYVRLIAERLEFLEEYVDRLRVVNNLKDE